MVVMLSEQVMKEERVIRPGDYVLDRRSRTAFLTEIGMAHVLNYLGAASYPVNSYDDSKGSGTTKLTHVIY